MKYIRTKDGIYNKRKLAFAFREDYCPTDKDYEKLLQTQIIKQADTIEELCDEFVYVDGNRHKNYPCYAVEPKNDVKYHDVIYGAIWTDKGLIYVAQLNEESEEWELL